MRHRRKRRIRPILIIAIIVIPIILLNLNRIFETTYGMLEGMITRPVREVSTDLIQTANNSRYSESNYSSQIYKGFDKVGSNAVPSREVSLSYEDVNRSNVLFMAEKGILPWKKYDSIMGYFSNYQEDSKEMQYKNKARYDATLEKWEVIVANNTNVADANSPLFTRTTNNFGASQGTTIATSRTIAKYTYGNLNNKLNAGISYILAHDKSKQFEIDKVQQALFLMRYASNSSANVNMDGTASDELVNSRIGSDYLGLNRQASVLSVNLFAEAKALQDYIDERTKLENANNGQEIVDNMENKYATGEAGIVAYNTQNKEYFVGPFSFNYIREVLVPSEGGNSEATNEDGIIVISAINNAKLYGLVNGKRTPEEIKDWEFIYTDVTYDKKTQKAIRNYEKEAINSGDITPNIYPYPNETFYIKIKSPNVDALTSIQFGMDSLNATSEVYDLTGTYSDVSWVVDKNTENWFLRADKSPAKKATSLYQLKSAKIITEHRDIRLEVGNVQQGYAQYSAPCIPLTMTFAGRVWYDGTEVQEKDAELDATYTQGESGIPNVIAYLYDTDDNLIQTTRTDENGQYQFNYVKVGKTYYVTFEYDGMKYKPTKLLGGNADINSYKDNMAEFSNRSHTIEDARERTDFNNSFYEITEDKAIGTDRRTREMQYTYDRLGQDSETGIGSIAKVQEFPIKASTITARISYPLHDNYVITNLPNSTLMYGDRNQANLEDLYYLIGVNNENEFYYVTVAPTSSTPITKSTLGTKFTKSHNCLTNINLGLIERDSSDFAIKNDVTQTVYTINEVVSNANINAVGAKQNAAYDIASRTGNYYYANYEQQIGYDQYSWRSSYMDNKNLLENDELQLYIQYKLTIKNQSNLLSGYITELVDYYDPELYYPVDTNEVWRYYDKDTNYMDSENGYANITMPQLTNYTSWAIKNNGKNNKEELGQVEWKSNSIYQNSNSSIGLKKMYTTSLERTRLQPGEELDIFIIFKVERINMPNKEGLYIINDNEDIGKQNIAQINGYRTLNYDGTVGGRVDKDSNPGNSRTDNPITYEDDMDSAPYLRVTVNAKDNGKGISGYVWNDSRENGLGIRLANNQIVGNGIIDRDDANNIIENFINNVQVELVRLEYDKETGEYKEVSFADDYEERSGNKIIKYTGPQAGVISNSEYEITTGMYRFDNLIESGTYKVRFTYGTETQLRNFVNIKDPKDSVKYNGHDYKSTEYAGPMDISSIQNPDTKVSIVVDSSDSISSETLEKIKSTVITLSDNLKTLNQNIDISTVNYAQLVNEVSDVRSIQTSPGDDMAGGLQLGINILNRETATGQYAGNRILIVFSDGYGWNADVAKRLMKSSLEAGIKVVGVGIDGANTDTFSVDGQYLDSHYDRKNTQVMFYNLIKEGTYTADKLYNLIYDYMQKHLILKENISHSTDYLENTTIVTDKTAKQVTGRLQVMQYSQKMSAENANVLNTDYINYLPMDIKQTSDWSEAIAQLAENTQMTADSYIINVNFEDGAGVTKELNLGLQEIPKSQVEVENDVYDIIVTLSNGNKIISLKDKLTKNVQIIPQSIYSVYLDEELMQGAKIDMVYKISVSNTGEVDSLWPYLRYSDFETKKKFYNNLYLSLYNQDGPQDITEEQLDDLLYTPIPIRVTKLYNYYDNQIFRAEENNRWQIINNTIRMNGDNVTREDYGSLIFLNNEDRRYLRSDTVMWKVTESPEVLERVKDRVDKYSIVETTSLKDIPIYPAMSTLVRDNAGVASLSTYVKFSKTLSARDVDDKDSLQYMNYTEINATESLTGRRDYNASVGDYKPGTIDEGDYDSTGEIDTSIAEKIIILPPFGGMKNAIFFALGASFLVILASGIVIIKRRFVE